MLKPAGRYECAYCRWHIADCQCTGLYRRERSARVWQAIQCWLLLLIHDKRSLHLDRYPARRLGPPIRL